MRFLFNKIKDFFIEMRLFNEMIESLKKEINETL